MALKLFSEFRSSASYRARIALNLKGLDYDYVSVDLNPGAEEHLSAEARGRNPQLLIPTLEHDGALISQSLAIADYLEDVWPEPSLYPADAPSRAQAKAFALAIGSELHPLNNLRVVSYLRETLGLDQRAVARWYLHWTKTVFTGLETTLTSRATKTVYGFADHPTVAEVFLVPQVAQAQRLGVDLSAYPLLTDLAARCEALEPFKQAAPEAQPDYAESQ